MSTSNNKKESIEIVPSGRIDYCCECKGYHGFDCPKDKKENWEDVSVLDKIFKKTKKVGDCIVWTGPKSKDGYGHVSYKSWPYRVHRFVYERTVGKVPKGLVLDHLCRNRACINIKHLEPVTSKENILRGNGVTANNSRKTHCKHGHPLSGDNLRIRPDRNGRVCNACLKKGNDKRRYTNRLNAKLDEVVGELKREFGGWEPENSEEQEQFSIRFSSAIEIVNKLKE